MGLKFSFPAILLNVKHHAPAETHLSHSEACRRGIVQWACLSAASPGKLVKHKGKATQKKMKNNTLISCSDKVKILISGQDTWQDVKFLSFHGRQTELEHFCKEKCGKTAASRCLRLIHKDLSLLLLPEAPVVLEAVLEGGNLLCIHLVCVLVRWGVLNRLLLAML